MSDEMEPGDYAFNALQYIDLARRNPGPGADQFLEWAERELHRIPGATDGMPTVVIIQLVPAERQTP